MNCPNCGAAVKEGKFCNYCGAKLPDDTKRVEVNIHKKIEDVAEMKRADYESEESKLKQKLMKKELRKGKVKWITCGSLFLLGILFLFVFRSWAMLGFALVIGVPVYIFASWLSKL